MRGGQAGGALTITLTLTMLFLADNEEADGSLYILIDWEGGVRAEGNLASARGRLFGRRPLSGVRRVGELLCTELSLA